MTVKKIIALILVLALLGAGAYYLRRAEREDQSHMWDLYEEIEPLQRQRDALVQERNNLEKDFALSMRDPATVQLLFRELDESLFSDVYPVMRDRGITGVLGLCRDTYPGLGKRISVDQYNRLLMDGWSSCYIYTSASNIYNLSDWLDTMETRTHYSGIPQPTAIYFPNNSYQNEFDEVLIRHGIKTVVTDAPDGRSATVTEVGGELWFTGAMPWNYTGVSSDTELLSHTEGANMTFTISFSNLWDAYEGDSFTATMDNWSSMLVTDDPLAENTVEQPGNQQQAVDPLEKPLLNVCDYDEAYQTHLDSVQNDAKYQTEYEQRQAEIDAQIAELDKQIREFYDLWQK